VKYQQHEEGHRKKNIGFERETTSGGPKKEEDHCETPTIGGLKEEEDQS
jgi:hypothetical protein